MPPLPLHYQLEQRLKAEILGGRWKPGQMIASERELMRQAGVSRATVRQAIGNLIQAGLLERVRGRGTFVAQPKLEQDMGTVYSFAQQLAAVGLHLDDHMIQRERVAASALDARLLGLAESEPLILIQRLRRLGEIPVMLNTSLIPYALCPDLLTEEIGSSLYQTLTERYNLPLIRSKDSLECLVADAALAHRLGIAVGAPLLYVERIAYTRGDLPVHIGRTVLRGDMFRFRINLSSEVTLMELKHDQLQR